MMKGVKFNFILLIFILGISFLVGCDLEKDEEIVLSDAEFKKINQTTEDQSSQAKESTKENVNLKIVAGGTEGWYPYQLRDEQGNAYGAGYDVLKAIVEPMGITVETSEGKPFNRLLKEVEDGTIDVFVGLYHNEEREKIYNYTESFAIDEIKVFVPKEKKFNFKSYNDLHGKVGIIPKGASFGDEFQKEKTNLTLREVTDTKKGFEMMLKGEADYYISAYYDVSAQMKDLGYNDEFVALPKNVNANELYFVVSKNSPLSDFIPKINEKLNQMKSDGSIYEILNKY